MMERAAAAAAWVWRTKFGKALAALLLVCGVVSAFGEAVDAWPKVAGFQYRPALLIDVNEYKPVVNELLRWKLEEFIAKQDDRASALSSEETTIRSKLPNETDIQTKIIFDNRLQQIKQEKQQVEQRKTRLMNRLKSIGGDEP